MNNPYEDATACMLGFSHFVHTA